MKRKVSMMQVGDVINAPVDRDVPATRLAIVLDVVPLPSASNTRRDHLFNIVYFAFGSSGQTVSGVGEVVKAGFVEYELFASQTPASQDAL